MSLTITKVSGNAGVVCQVNAVNGTIETGCWLGDGARIGGQTIQLGGWINPQSVVKVWTSKGASNIAYKADEHATPPQYVVQQSNGSNPRDLWRGPVASANLAVTINADGSLSMSSD